MYTLQAIICDRKVIESANIEGAEIVTLCQGKAMIPFFKSFCESRNLPSLPLMDGGLRELPSTIAKLCHVASVHGKLAYIEAEFFGGDGSQAHSLWEIGKVAESPYIALNAINLALQFLGVKKGKGVDEFDTLNLGKFRNTEDWLEEIGA